jgi:ferritin
MLPRRFGPDVGSIAVDRAWLRRGFLGSLKTAMLLSPDSRRLSAGGAATSLTDHSRAIPMISEAMRKRMNEQINRELYSAYLYLSLSAHSERANLKGTAAWFMAKHAEEMSHALKMYRYLLDQDAQVELTTVTAPPASPDGVMAMFEGTLAHEREVTAAINDLVDQALSEKDHATNIFLQWFVTEQIEEEATVNDIIGRLKLFGDKGQGLLMIDNELGAAAKTMGQGAGANTAAAA